MTHPVSLLTPFPAVSHLTQFLMLSAILLGGAGGVASFVVLRLGARRWAPARSAAHLLGLTFLGLVAGLLVALALVAPADGHIAEQYRALGNAITAGGSGLVIFAALQRPR